MTLRRRRLYGLMLHQAYRYFRQYTKDAMIIKLIVCIVFLHSGSETGLIAVYVN